MACDFIDKGSKQVSDVLEYHYSNNNPKQSQLQLERNTSWQDTLFSFYNPKEEKDKLSKPRDPIQMKIIKARVNQFTRKQSMSIIDVDLLNEIQMMQILFDD